MDAAIRKVLAELHAGKFHPVYFLQGEEPYFIDLLSGIIEQKALAEAEKSFNQIILYGSDISVAQVLTHARRFPMMAERQVVIVKEAQEIQDLNKESGSKLLLNYLSQPVPSTILVFCHKHKTLDGRKELGKAITKFAVTINSKKLYDNQLPGFVKEHLNESGLQANDEAITMLCEFIGNDLSRIVNEIEKIRITLADDNVISADQVLAQVGISKQYNIFELQKALISRDRLKAARIVNYFEANPRRNPVIPVVAFLFSFFSKLLLACRAPDKSETALANLLKINQYSARDYRYALRNYPTDKVISNLSLLKEADLKLKGVAGGSTSEGQVLKELVARLMM